MSADRWTTCPKCYAEQRIAADKFRQEFYGKLPAADYEAKLQDVLKTPIDEEETFREDRQIGVYADKFVVDYHGLCQTCGYKKSFKHTEQVP